MWDAAFTIQSAHRRMHVRRRRRARALKRAMGASNAAAAWNENLEHGLKKVEAAAAAKARGEGELDAGNGNHDAGGLAASSGGGGPGGRNNRGQPGTAAGASPPGQGGSNNMTSASIGATTTICTTGDQVSQSGGQGQNSGISENAPHAASPIESEFEDLGDIALAALGLARNPPPTPAPAVVVQEPVRAAQPVVEAKPVSAPALPTLPMLPTPPPPSQEETLEYYEAKMRYLAAQEKAHGASACKIQARKKSWCCVSVWVLGRVLESSVISQAKHTFQKTAVSSLQEVQAHARGG